MRDPARILKLMPKLQTLWLMLPDYRFTQVVDAIEVELGTDPYYKEDDQTEAAIDRLIKRMGG